jgi:NAD(P)-dependent dehydrogenase (short-subunit alcohol dehydrogenase family)
MTPSFHTRSTKVVLITDAGSAIGEAAARHLAALGHKVMLGARSLTPIAALADDIARNGGEARYQELDVRSRGSVRAFAVMAEACYGRIDVLVNTSGEMGGVAAVLPAIRAQGIGHVFNLATEHGLMAQSLVTTIGVAIDGPADPAVSRLTDGIILRAWNA